MSVVADSLMRKVWEAREIRAGWRANQSRYPVKAFSFEAA
jgi:hypothetical protein